MAMLLTSSAIAQGTSLPARFATRAAGGENVSVPLAWTGAPAATRSFAIVVIDRHPVARGWVHWLVADIPSGVSSIAEGASGTAAMPAGAIELANSFGPTGWGGPQPPPGTGPHDYESTLYSLDIARLGVEPGASWLDVSRAMEGHILSAARLTGRFGR